MRGGGGHTVKNTTWGAFSLHFSERAWAHLEHGSSLVPVGHDCIFPPRASTSFREPAPKTHSQSMALPLRGSQMTSVTRHCPCWWQENVVHKAARVALISQYVVWKDRTIGISGWKDRGGGDARAVMRVTGDSPFDLHGDNFNLQCM